MYVISNQLRRNDESLIAEFSNHHAAFVACCVLIKTEMGHDYKSLFPISKDDQWILDALLKSYTDESNI